MSDREVLVETQEQFQFYIDNLVETGKSFIALFTAPTWCQPCRQVEPHWNKAQEQLTEHVFIKVDMGESPEDTGAHWATELFGIRGVPQMKLFNDDGVFDIKSRAVVPLIKEITTYD